MGETGQEKNVNNLELGARKALLRELSQISESAVRIGDRFYTSDTIIDAFYRLTPQDKGEIWDSCEKLEETDSIFPEKFYMERITYFEQWAFADEPAFFYSLSEIPAVETTKSRIIERRPLGVKGFSILVSRIS